jgi:hypothetical protein
MTAPPKIKRADTVKRPTLKYVALLGMGPPEAAKSEAEK